MEHLAKHIQPWKCRQRSSYCQATEVPPIIVSPVTSLGHSWIDYVNSVKKQHLDFALFLKPGQWWKKLVWSPASTWEHWRQQEANTNRQHAGFLLWIWPQLKLWLHLALIDIRESPWLMFDSHFRARFSRIEAKKLVSPDWILMSRCPGFSLRHRYYHKSVNNWLSSVRLALMNVWACLACTTASRRPHSCSWSEECRVGSSA